MGRNCGLSAGGVIPIISFLGRPPAFISLLQSLTANVTAERLLVSTGLIERLGAGRGVSGRSHGIDVYERRADLSDHSVLCRCDPLPRPSANDRNLRILAIASRSPKGWNPLN